MITDIRKYTFLVYHNDYDKLLNALREAGVVHISQKRKITEGSSVDKELKLLKRYRSAIKHISSLAPGAVPAGSDIKPEAALEGFEQLLKNIDEARQQIEVLKPEAEKASPWGEFDRSSIEKLGSEGWEVKLYSCSEKRFDSRWEEEYTIEIISSSRGRLYFAIVHRSGEEPDIQADPEKMPVRTAGLVNAEMEALQNGIEEKTSSLAEMAPAWLHALEKGNTSLINTVEYFETSSQADKYAEDNLYVLEGWVPVDDENKVTEVLQTLDCFSFVSLPEEGEKIPVILKNSKFAKLFEPIGKLYALPNYREMDLTPFFAPFFVLFFGMCLGDAGYGLLFLVGGFFLRKKVKKDFRPFVTLAQYFGVATIVLGMVSGTFFGMNLIDSGYTISQQSVVKMQDAGVPPNVITMLEDVKGVSFGSRKAFTEEVSAAIGETQLREYKTAILKSADSKLPFINSFRHLMLEPISMFYLALAIGGLQIIFGMVVKIFNITKYRGFKYSLSTIGWVLLVLTLVVFKGGPMLGYFEAEKTKLVSQILMGLSAVLILFFNSPGKNVFAQAGLGIWDAYGMITGMFGDLLSYIRLFALGISSSILGFVFNDISMQMASIPFVGWLLFIIMFIVGHSLNLGLATLGAFVHPMRLTFVEFYKNAGFSGGGIEYKPFKIKQ